MNYWKIIKNFPFITWYLTYKKVANYLKYRLDLNRKPLVTSSFPPEITFQPSAYCNTNCRLCPVGLGIKGPKRGFLEVAKFCKVIDEAKDYLIAVNFADWGEPFLNPEIFKMIRYAEEKKVITHASTNLHRFKNEDDLKKLLDCKLSFLIISLHGISQKTYSAYQPGKDFEATLNKIRALIDLKKSKFEKPIINLAFAITKKNQFEIENMRLFSDSLGVDCDLYTASINLRFHLPISIAVGLVEEWAQDEKIDLCDNSRFSNKQNINAVYNVIRNEKTFSFSRLDELKLAPRHYCLEPWESLTVNWDGTVSLCCSDYSKYIMGDTRKDSITSIWKNKKYQSIRAFLSGRLNSSYFSNPCATCTKY